MTEPTSRKAGVMRFSHVKRFKRGAKWDNGEPRMCTRCGAEQDGNVPKRRQATVTALIRDGIYKIPVAYCPAHIPIEVAY